MHDMLKRKIRKEHEKQKESKCFQYGCNRVSRRYESYMVYLEGDGPHQIVMIVCECIWYHYSSYNDLLMLSYKSFTHNMHTFCYS